MRVGAVRPDRVLRSAFLIVLTSGVGLVLGAGDAAAQAGATVSGVVTHAGNRTPVSLARIEVEGTGLRALSTDDGGFRLEGVPSGPRVLVVTWFSTGGQRVEVTVPQSGSIHVDIEYQLNPFLLSEVMVTTGLRVPQRFIEAPVAMAVVPRAEARNYSTTGQHPQVLKGLPGMDVSSNGVHDFNVNSRGFNADLAQRLLVLMDGRDLAIPFLAAQEWSALSLPLEDIERIEVARGPGAALYGANAYNGVINIITPAPRDVVGSKVSLAGGELSTLRADIRHARVFGPQGQFGIRANVGLYRSDDWHLSRTNVGDLDREYGRVIDPADFPVNTPAPGYEVLPLKGQTVGSLPARAIGAPDPVETVYGSTRIDYYAANGAVGTVEGGAARTANQLFMTNVGRFQVFEAWRPWARVAWTDARFSVSGWYSGRRSEAASLASGSPVKEGSGLLHVESQWNESALDDRLNLVIGASYRRNRIDSKGTLVAPEDDARNDWYSGVFGQLQFALTPELSLVVAGRYDGSNLFDSEFSPKAALVYSPDPDHSMRVTAGRAYQTPRMTNFFLNVPLGLPANLRTLEDDLRIALPGVLDGVATGTLFTTSSSVPALALGNPVLGVEHVTSYEAGYRGAVAGRFSFSIDGYYSVVRDFVSALLPYANPALGPWSAPETVAPGDRDAVEAEVFAVLGNASGLTRLNDGAGSTAIVFSYGNAGRANEWGVELSAAAELTPQLQVEGNYSYFGYTVDEGVPLVPGDLIVPNTPTHKANVKASFTQTTFDVWAGLNLTTAHDWSSGFFQGRIPASQTVDAGIGRLLGSRIRAHIVATNLFGQATYHIYGGSIDRRRVLLGMTAYF